jgi:hypothetical protein
MWTVEIKVIEFSREFGGNPLPYVPAFREWNDHVEVCAPCARVDQLAAQGKIVNPRDLCEAGAFLQLAVSRRMQDQHEISLQN